MVKNIGELFFELAKLIIFLIWIVADIQDLWPHGGLLYWASFVANGFIMVWGVCWFIDWVRK